MTMKGDTSAMDRVHPGGPWTIRPAVVADAPGIARVHVLSWQAAYAGLLPAAVLDGLSVERRAAGWGRSLRDPSPRRHVLVATEGGGSDGQDAVTVGIAEVGAAADADSDATTGELRVLYLLPDRWRRGLGRRLQDAALDALRGEGFTRATLWVLRTNSRAQAFYRATGWSPDDAARQEEFRGAVLDEVRFRRDL